MNPETFWAQVGAYNEATWPVQVIFVITAMILTFLVFTKPGTKIDGEPEGSSQCLKAT